MAYDSLREVVVLYGGRDSDRKRLRDTWEWDGAHWIERRQELGSPLPDASDDSPIAFDSRRGVTVLVGYGNKVWEWDGLKWANKDCPDDTPISAGSMAYDKERGVCVQYSPVDQGEEDEESKRESGTWEWDGVTWRHVVCANAPRNMQYTYMAYDAQKKVVALVCESSVGDPQSWTFDGQDWTLLNAGEMRDDFSGHAVAYDLRRSVLVLHGGERGDSILDDTWELEGGRWRIARVACGPSPYGWTRCLCYDSARRQTLLIADDKKSVDGAPVYRMWSWCNATWSELALRGAPSARNSLSLADDPSRGVVCWIAHHSIEGEPVPLATLWEWNGDAWRQVTTLPDVPLHGDWVLSPHSVLFYHPTWREVFYWGKDSAKWSSGDSQTKIVCRSWNGQRWKLRAELQCNPDCPLVTHKFYYHAWADHFICYDQWGGKASTTTTWVFDWKNFHQIDPDLSPQDGITDRCATYDSVRKRVVLFGGRWIKTVDSHWEWDGVAWRMPPSNTKPPARDGRAMCIDTARSTIVLFGDSDGLNDTWEYGPDD